MKEKIREFIIENFLFGQDEGLKDDSSFLDEGIIDSTGILELVNFIEEEYSITVDDEDLIPENLDSIIQEWRTQQTETEEVITTEETDSEAGEEEEVVQQATRQVTLGGSYYTVDRSVGLVTVTAPRPLLEKVELYIDTLKKELFRQVIIEAKIVEVFLQDNSK